MSIMRRASALLRGSCQAQQTLRAATPIACIQPPLAGIVQQSGTAAAGIHGIHKFWSITNPWGVASFSTTPSFDDEVQEINNLFVVAREEIEYAKEDADTVYFNEDLAEAKKAVDECMSRWHALLERLDEEEQGKLRRSMGLKMEQLKAEYDEVASLHLED